MGGVDIQFSVIVVEEAGSRKPDTLRLQIGRLCHQSHTITLIISTISFFAIKTHFHYNRILKFSSWHPFHDSDQKNADLMGSICRRNMNITNIELNTLSLWCSWFHKYSLKPFIFLQHSLCGHCRLHKPVFPMLGSGENLFFVFFFHSWYWSVILPSFSSFLSQMRERY